MKLHLSLQTLCNQWAWTWALFLKHQLRFFQVFHFLMVAFYAKTFQCLKWQLTHKIWFWFSCFPLARHHAGVSTQNSAVSYNNQPSHGRTHQFPEKYRGFKSLISLSENSDGLNPELPLNYNWAVAMANHSIPLGSILFWWYHIITDFTEESPLDPLKMPHHPHPNGQVQIASSPTSRCLALARRALGLSRRWDDQYIINKSWSIIFLMYMADVYFRYDRKICYNFKRYGSVKFVVGSVHRT